MASGVDLSNNNGYNAVDKLPRSVDFVYAKLTEGMSYIDPDGPHIFARCQATGRKVGGYHFAHPFNGGIPEADFFLKHWHPGPGQLIPALDLETGAGNLRPYCIDFARSVYTARHCDTLLYGSSSFIAEHVGGPVEHMQLWLADWASSPHLPSGWKSWDVWQYKVGKISGIGSVDLDVGKMPLIEYIWKHPLHASKPANWHAWGEHWKQMYLRLLKGPK